MFELKTHKMGLQLIAGEPIASGSANASRCHFTFDPAWEAVDKTAVFQAGGVRKAVLLDGEDCCTIPWEVLTKPRTMLYAGVYGTRGEALVMPTVMAELGEIQAGAALGEWAQPPEPDLYAQILEVANQARETAQSVREDADAGIFGGQGAVGPQGPAGEKGEDGHSPVKGVDYFTQTEKEAMVAEVLAALPQYAGEVLA